MKHAGLRRDLLARRESMLCSLAELDVVVAEGRDDGDLADFTARKDEQEERRAQLRRNLSLIDRTLGQVEAGTYGTCEDCESEIPEARLKALRYVTTCRPCQEIREKEQTTNGGPERVVRIPRGGTGK